jgi:hypothetical protein
MLIFIWNVLFLQEHLQLRRIFEFTSLAMHQSIKNFNVCLFLVIFLQFLRQFVILVIFGLCCLLFAHFKLFQRKLANRYRGWGNEDIVVIPIIWIVILSCLISFSFTDVNMQTQSLPFYGVMDRKAYFVASLLIAILLKFNEVYTIKFDEARDYIFGEDFARTYLGKLIEKEFTSLKVHFYQFLFLFYCFRFVFVLFNLLLSWIVLRIGLQLSIYFCWYYAIYPLNLPE